MANVFSDDDVVVICKPVSEGLPSVASLGRHCEICHQMVWLSESTARQAGEKAKVCCVACALKQDVLIGNKFEEPSFETKQQVAEAINARK